jgi:ankyrin repeat protein
VTVRGDAPRSPGRRVLLAACIGAVAAPTVRGQAPPPDEALIKAAEAGDAAEVRRLLARGASVKARDAAGRTALVAATYGNRPDVAKLLIQAGADVNAQDDIRNSAFLLAGARGHLEILKLTLAAGADLRSTNRYGGTALIPACHYGHVETVRELLKTRIDVDHVNDLGWTALLEAVILGDGGAAHSEIVRMLLAAKANPGIADRQGVTPLAHARSRGYAAIAKLIEGAGGR